jgi:hypothetical protein
MIRKLSRYRTDDLVEVRSKPEILATLDQHGSVDGMPFMPEMLQYCGRCFRVGAVAHKTCDTERQTRKGRRLQATVHLAGLRCDGLMLEGVVCKAEYARCRLHCPRAIPLYWREIWLKRVNEGLHKDSRHNGHSLSARCHGAVFGR